MDALLGIKHGSGKRGPAPKLQQQIERIGQLPKPQQRFVMQMLGITELASVARMKMRGSLSELRELRNYGDIDYDLR